MAEVGFPSLRGARLEIGRRPGTMLELRNQPPGFIHQDALQDSLQWVERSKSSLVLWVYAVDRIAQ